MLKNREEGNSEQALQRLVQRFGNREHLIGIAVGDRQSKVIAITPELANFSAGTLGRRTSDGGPPQREFIHPIA